MFPDVTVEVQRTDGGPVLVKATSSESGASRLANEAARLERARHPGVVELLSREPRRLELVWAGSETLATLRTPLPVAAAILASVGATIADLHDIGLVHGMLDPSHVVIGADGRPRICGLGGPHRRPEAAGPADDVAQMGRLIDQLIGPDAELEPIPERRWTRRHWSGYQRRALQTLADQATHEDPARRPTARTLAAAIADSVPDAHLEPLDPAVDPAPPSRRAKRRRRSASGRADVTSGVEPPAPSEEADPLRSNGDLGGPIEPAEAHPDHAASDRSTPGEAPSELGPPSLPDPAEDDPPSEPDRPSHGDSGDGDHPAAEGPGTIDQEAAKATFGPIDLDSSVDHRCAPLPDPDEADDRAETDDPDEADDRREDEDLDEARLLLGMRLDTPEETEGDEPPRTLDRSRLLGSDQDPEARLQRPRPPSESGGRSAPAVARRGAGRPRSARTSLLLAAAVIALLITVAVATGAARRNAPDNPEVSTAALPTGASPRPTSGDPRGAEEVPSDGAVGTSEKAGAGAGSTNTGTETRCAEVSGAVADPDGDGCEEAVAVHGTTITVGTRQYAVGQTGDEVTVGDWDCDGTVTPALVRPTTGEVFVFESWASPSDEVTVSPAAVVPGARRLEPAPADRCRAPQVVTGDHQGRTLQLPGATP